MTILSVCGVKGGCGASAITAALAWHRQEQSKSTLAIDLCPHNLLRLHFGVPWSDEAGWHASLLAGRDWTQAAWRIGGEALMLMPHGDLPRGTPHAPGLRADWLRRELAALDRPADDMTLLDTPLTEGMGRELAFAACSHVLAVLPPDPISNALAAKLEAELLERGMDRGRILFLINQFDPARRLDRDVELLLRLMLGSRLAPLPVMWDETMREALAAGLPVAAFAPDSQAVDDLRQLALWLSVRLSETQSEALC
ncbi:cellulose biosynthesis protein BcsQ [Chromobacterium alticapitis]|uniref:Cellulose synthase operon protein YhjQ n=1 Tax=Chromobacterium alticapitis TaxID=2073169 RepID=A0A2S5DII4_9NEIS|nr:cellulose biosynthesis protein BcsQ [Chromobacterium alticapitis]POZ62890.1 cellulose synthase operon protein YhjQ [Chromobacterium alticapitis]